MLFKLIFTIIMNFETVLHEKNKDKIKSLNNNISFYKNIIMND